MNNYQESGRFFFSEDQCEINKDDQEFIKGFNKVFHNDSIKDENINIIEENKKFNIIENKTKEDIDHIRKNYYKIENLEKPIKSMANYKKEELIIISQKLNIYNNNLKNKKDIYEKINEYIK